MKHHLTKFLALLLISLLLTGCWQDASLPEEEGPLVPGASSGGSASAVEPVSLPAQLALPYYPAQTLDPVTCPDGVQQTVSALLCEGLFALDQTLSPQPRLCSSYSYDSAALTYTFQLRRDVLFSDGSALTAADAAATLNRARTSPRYSARLSAVASVSAGEGFVTVVLFAPNTGLPALLDIPIVKSGTETAIPVGTGPYRFESDPDGGAVLVSNPLWWQGAQPVDRIVLRPADDPDAMLYQFASHETQLITADLTGSDPVSVTGSIAFQDADTSILQYVGLNVRRAPLSDPALRRALSLGIDRNQIVSAFLSGHGRAAQLPVSPVSPGYPSALDRPYSYSAFQQAMTAAGFVTGKTRSLTLIVNEENTFKVSTARAVAAALSVFDLKIDVSVLPWDAYASALASGKFDLYYGEVKLTADWDLRPLAGTGGALNRGGFSDALLDTQLSALLSAPDRTAALSTVCYRIQALAPILPICFKTTSVLMQDGVLENLTPTASNPFYDLPSCIIHLSEE